MFVRILVALALLTWFTGSRFPVAAADSPDPFVWLENVNAPRSLDWVKAENAKTLAVLQQDPHFSSFYAGALKIAEATDRIPSPVIINGRIFNFWQDAAHVRGIWRSTSLADYARAEPAWTTVLDLDALANAEHQNWVWEGADCDSPSKTRCLITLSDGGEDAATVREFDLTTGQFVAGGFSLPRAKQTIAWVDDDTLLVSRAWSPEEITASGYPYIVKRLRRGRPLSSAVEVYCGTASDLDAAPFELSDGAGHRFVFVLRGVSFFENETHLVTASGTPKLEMPLKSSIEAVVAGRLLVRLDDDWNAGGRLFTRGSLVSVDLAALTADPQHLQPTVVYVPGPRQALNDVGATRDGAVVTTLDNVSGRAFVYTPAANDGWRKRALVLPDKSTLELGSTDIYGSQAFLSVTNFLTPTTLSLLDTGSGTLKTVKTLKPRFDASQDVVEQYAAASTDGTRIPYFIVHPRHVKYDGTNPTILNAYGGFADSLTPRYDGVLGALWLAHGGVYVLANIRGGGEFGPAWHEAGLKTRRQIIYDDFAAVGRDLIARKIAAPARLGIEGGSNGGLLMGVEFTQHPELWHAVDMRVPLLDMLRYEHIAAGASWVGEYGTVAKPDERAFLASISPYANLRAGVAYPEPFIWTTTKDDRVGPQHARKFAAKLASLHVPYLFYEVTEGGHGAGANLKERAFTSALEYTYFARQLLPAGGP